jgi:membrane-bound metal-dependent hydrolase YbcI (DUF457 family)
MMKKTHRFVGGSTAFVVGTSVGLPIAVVVGVSALSAFASTFPDDVERPVRLKRLTIWPGLPHRQLTHYPVIQLLVVALLALLMIAASPFSGGEVIYLAGALAIAWVMHSVADAMTIDRRGIALLWPIRRRGYHLLPRPLRARVDTNSVSEKVFGVVWSAIVLCFIYARFRHSIPA